MKDAQAPTLHTCVTTDLGGAAPPAEPLARPSCEAPPGFGDTLAADASAAKPKPPPALPPPDMPWYTKSLMRLQ